jgi:hypothetical protein
MTALLRSASSAVVRRRLADCSTLVWFSADEPVSIRAPRAGGDKKRKGLKEERRVSAHAPAQGAT